MHVRVQTDGATNPPLPFSKFLDSNGALNEKNSRDSLREDRDKEREFEKFEKVRNFNQPNSTTVITI